MSEKGIGLKLMESIGVCTLLVTVGPYLSKYYLFYLIIIFSLIILVFEKLVPSRRKCNFTKNQKVKGKRKAFSETPYNDKIFQRRASNEITPRKLCISDMMATVRMSQKTHMSARSTPNCMKKISRKMNCIARSRVFRSIIDQVRTPKRKKYSLEFCHASKNSFYSVNNLKRKSFHLSLQGLQ